MKPIVKKALIGGGILAALFVGYKLLKKSPYEGLLLRNATSGAIYIIEKGKKRWIQSLPTLQSMFPGIAAVDTDINILNSIPNGVAIP